MVADIIDYLLNQSKSAEELKRFCADILQFDCILGVIPELIYTQDIHGFFENFYPDLTHQLIKCEEGTGHSSTVQDLKAIVVWSGFEESVRDILQEICVKM